MCDVGRGKQTMEGALARFGLSGRTLLWLARCSSGLIALLVLAENIAKGCNPEVERPLAGDWVLQKQAGFPFLDEPESLEADRCGSSHASGWRGGRGLPVAVRAMRVFCMWWFAHCLRVDAGALRVEWAVAVGLEAAMVWLFA